MALREIFADLGFKWDRSKPQEANRQVDSLKTSVEGLVAVFAGNEILNAVNQFASELDVLDDLSAQTRIATDDLQVLGYAAQLSGSSAEEMNASLTILQRSLGRTSEATGPQVDALKDLGIALKDASGAPRALNEVLPDIFTNFNNLESATKKAEVANALFGRGGVRLIPTLERGQEGMAALRAELEEFGGVVNGEVIGAAGGYRDSIAKLDRAWFALKGTLAASVFPQLEKVVTAFAKGVGRMANFVGQTTLADSAVLTLAAALGGPLLKALGPFIKPGLKFAAIFFAVDEVVAFLQGKDSYLGDLINAAFGEGAADAVREWVNFSIAEFKRFQSSADETFAAIQNDNSTFTQAALATLVGFFRDAIAGFPAFRAGAEAAFIEVGIAFNEMVLGLEEGWNRFISGLSIPESVKEGLTIDTSDTALGIQDAQTRAAAARDNQEFYLRGGRRTTPAGPARQGRSDGAPDTRALVPLAGMPGVAAPGFAPAFDFAGANGGAPALPAPPPSFSTTPFAAPVTNIQAPTQVTNHVAVNLPAGTSPRDARAVGDAAGKAVENASKRSSAQALVQRAQ